MDNDSYTGFMALHSHPIVESLAQTLNVPKRKALDMFPIPHTLCAELHCSHFNELLPLKSDEVRN
jgi:hypothetical protein